MKQLPASDCSVACRFSLRGISSILIVIAISLGLFQVYSIHRHEKSSNNEIFRQQLRSYQRSPSRTIKNERHHEKDEVSFFELRWAPRETETVPLSVGITPNNATKTTGKFAYVYVVGGIRPGAPSYRNYLYDVIISTYLMRREGSTADIVVFLQVAWKYNGKTIPEEDKAILDRMGIRYYYIPKTPDENFYRITLEKFRALSLTQYDRVLVMDSDVMAMGSMDYLFEFSLNGTLKENVVIQGKTEPANAGFFLLTPHRDDYGTIVSIIHEREVRTATLPYPHWDDIVGWGNAFVNGDYWEDIKGNKGTLWTFYCAYSDQGLLYHWVKFIKKSFSIIRAKDIENWGANAYGKLRMEKRLSFDIFEGVRKRKCWSTVVTKGALCEPPRSDHVHFTSKLKPWFGGPKHSLSKDLSNPDPFKLWFNVLYVLNDELKIGIDFEKWPRGQHFPEYGMYPSYKTIATSIQRRVESENETNAE